jgi:hypothetical protein
MDPDTYCTYLSNIRCHVAGAEDYAEKCSNTLTAMCSVNADEPQSVLRLANQMMRQARELQDHAGWLIEQAQKMKADAQREGVTHLSVVAGREHTPA